MFKHTLQPPVISLFSSSSSHPFLLCSICSTSSSPSFPQDSWIALVDDATDQFITTTTSKVASSTSTNVSDKTTTMVIHDDDDAEVCSSRNESSSLLGATWYGFPTLKSMKGSTKDHQYSDTTTLSSSTTTIQPPPIQSISTSSSSSSSSSTSTGPISGPVLHLQSPDIKSTFIRFGGRSDIKNPNYSYNNNNKLVDDDPEVLPLGIEAGYLHFFLKPLGEGMNFYLDVLVQDERNSNYLIRVSTFQTEPRYFPFSNPPLLHLPLQFPTPSPHSLTSWSLLSLPLPELLFSITDFPEGPSPAPRYKSLSSLEIHANCRLRRIWCTQEKKSATVVVGESMALRGMMTELCLFAAS